MSEAKKAKGSASGGGQGAVYGLGLIGALVYYWRGAETAEAKLAAVGKAVVWPAFVVYDLLGHLSGRPADPTTKPD
jgi:hypothetical protein